MSDTEHATARSTGPDFATLRKTLGAFVTGVTVVSTIDASGHPRGMTANSFTSVSLEPPLVLICIADRAGSYDAFAQSESFAINILSEEQKDTAVHFASRHPDKFAEVAWSTATTGAPVLKESLGWLDCSTYSKEAMGDHLVLVGKVENFSNNATNPLLYNRGTFATLGLEEEALASHLDEAVQVGWIIDSGHRVVLKKDVQDGQDCWSIPMAPLHGAGATSRQGSKAGPISATALVDIGIEVENSFLYSVMDLPSGDVCIVHRATSASVDLSRSPDVQAFDFDDIPWHLIRERHVRNMLRRYIQESSNDRFGIYLGSLDNGTVAIVESHQSWQDRALSLPGIELSPATSSLTSGDQQ